MNQGAQSTAHHSLASILIWAEKGNRTRQQAKDRLGQSVAWLEALRDGLIMVDQKDMVKLTEKGSGELTLMRMSA